MKLSQLKIDPEFQSKIPPLQFEEEQQLEQNIIAEGRLLNPIITWNGYILDGHTRYELYKQYGCERYVEMLHIINEAWKGNVDAYLAGVIRGVARFISVYEGEYSRERLVQQLARTHPKTITQLAQKDTGSSANRHMRQILRIYNGASREMSLPLKN